MTVFQKQHSLQSKNIPNVTLVKEIKPVVNEKCEFYFGDVFLRIALLAMWDYQESNPRSKINLLKSIVYETPIDVDLDLEARKHADSYEDKGIGTSAKFQKH